LTDVDRDSFAVLVRVASARGNFVSLSAAPPALLAACQNPFRRGDGVLDSVVEFVATPAVAAQLLAGLEYMHVDDSGAADAGGGVDNVTVSVLDGGCFFYDHTRLTGCPRLGGAG